MQKLWTSIIIPTVVFLVVVAGPHPGRAQSPLVKTTVFSKAMASLPAPLASGADPTYTVIDHPSSEPPKGAYLGHSVAALDWNTDGVLDVAGGAPGENRTYVFLGPDFAKYEVVTVDGLAESGLERPRRWTATCRQSLDGAARPDARRTSGADVASRGRVSPLTLAGDGGHNGLRCGVVPCALVPGQVPLDGLAVAALPRSPAAEGPDESGRYGRGNLRLRI